MRIICLTTILEAIDAIAQRAAFSLAVIQENLLVEELNEFAYRRFLLRINIAPTKDSIACRLPIAHAVEPASQLALNLPEQVVRFDIQWAVDNGTCHNIDRLEHRM